MALQKPYNINIRGQTLDSKDQIKITWQVSGDPSVAYQIRIYRNSNNALIHDTGKITSFAQSHTLPSNTIANGIEYKIQVTIWNQAGLNISSDNEIFQTSSRPIVTIDSIGTIPSPSYSFGATYYQAESISLRSWVVYLYDSNKTKISQSSISIEPNIEYIFSNMKSGTSYYIEFQVTSAKGLVGTSGLVSFTVQYQQPDIKVNLTAENTDNAGMLISWNTIQIIGTTTKSPIFVDGTYIDLTNDTFSWSEGFSLSQDFTIKMWIKSFKSNVDLFTLRGINGNLALQYSDDDQCLHLIRTVYGYNSHYVSKPFINNGATGFFVCIQQIQNDMNIFQEVIN